MVRAVDEQDAHALDGRARELAVRHRLLDPLVDRRPEALRDDAADDLVHELVADVALHRLEHDVAVAELAAPARLLLVAGVCPRFRADRLEVRHARRVQLDVHPEAALDAFERDLDVHLAHAREDLLAGLLVAAEPEGRIFLGEPADRARHLLLVALRLRRHGEAHHRLGEAEVDGLDVDVLVEQQVAGLRLLQLRDRADVAGAEVLAGRVLLALQLEQRAHALLALRAAVDQRRVAGDGPVEHSEEVDAPSERIGDRLEDERGG